VLSKALSGSSSSSPGHSINKVSSSMGGTTGPGIERGSGISASGFDVKEGGSSTFALLQHSIAAWHGLERDVGASSSSRSMGLLKKRFLSSAFLAFLFAHKASIASFLFVIFACLSLSLSPLMLVKIPAAAAAAGSVMVSIFFPSCVLKQRSRARKKCQLKSTIETRMHGDVSVVDIIRASLKFLDQIVFVSTLMTWIDQLMLTDYKIVSELAAT